MCTSRLLRLPAWGALLVLAIAFPAAAQELPACDDAGVFEVASDAIVEAHRQSNFGGLGGEGKIIQALEHLRALRTESERSDMAGGIALLARQAGIPVEDIRPCLTTEWSFRQRAAVFIMRSPTDPGDWGLFMYNVALDLPVGTGWLVASGDGEGDAAGEREGAPGDGEGDAAGDGDGDGERERDD